MECQRGRHACFRSADRHVAQAAPRVQRSAPPPQPSVAMPSSRMPSRCLSNARAMLDSTCAGELPDSPQRGRSGHSALSRSPLQGYSTHCPRTLTQVEIEKRLLPNLRFLCHRLEVADGKGIEADGDGPLECRCVRIALALREVRGFFHRIHRASHWARSEGVARRAEIRRMVRQG